MSVNFATFASLFCITMIEGIIYRYVSPSGKSYIGQTTQEKLRKEHWNTVGPYAGLKINRAREKYGINSFTYEVLGRRYYADKVSAKQSLDALEVYYIGFYDSYNNGYNCTIGGESTLGYTHTNETRIKLSEVRKGNKLSTDTKDKISNKLKGRKLSEEWKNKIGASLKGKTKSQGHITKMSLSKSRGIIQYDCDGTYLNEYVTIKEASANTKISISAIYKCLSGKNRTSGGFIWKYKDY